MNSERWQSCTEIFHLAVEQSPPARAALLARTCAGDERLRRRVELLLKSHDAAGNFIAEPAFTVAPGLLVADPEMLLGQQLGAYRLEEVAGVGGMGVVYRARDERLGRKVALKILPPSLSANEAELARLQREARTASALNHPNIVTVHEIGQVDATPFVVTEFVEGPTLRERISQGPVSPDEAVEIAIQIASALVVAHRAGIVHRDIKPENVILRPDGYVKVLDFGIAKAIPQETPAERKMILGTARYISPEQASGETVDARTDLWSLGVVLYEMLAGRAPFQGATATEVIAAAQGTEPPPLRLRAPGLPRVVARCLRKNPAGRHQTAAELLSALRDLKTKSANARARGLGWAAIAALLCGAAFFYSGRAGQVEPPAAIEKSIAVLPFDNLSTDPDSAYLAAVLHDDVVTGLAKIKDLKVIARDSVMSYRGAVVTGVNFREIASRLGVANLLQGSVRRSKGRVIVNVALLGASDPQPKWTQHYERTFDGALRLQGELALEIAGQLRATLTPAETHRAAADPTRDTQADLLYLHARGIELAEASPERLHAALELYQQAVDLEPNYALARARLSLCASLLFEWEGRGELKAKARAEAEAALRLRPELGEAWLAQAYCSLWGDGDYDRALRELGRAAELLPNSVDVSLAAAIIYKRQQRYRERLAALQRAEALDPMNRRVLEYLTNTFRWVRNWPAAIQSLDRIVALAGDGKIPGWRWCRANDEFRLTGELGALKKAIAEETAAGPPPGPPWLHLARYETAMLERNYAEADRSLAGAPARSLREPPFILGGHAQSFDEALLAVVTQSDSRPEKLAAARRDMVAALSAEATPFRWAGLDLALLDAFLGHKEEAIREALSAADLRDGIERNLASSMLAMVYAQTGEKSKAIALIDHLLTVPCELQGGSIYNMTLTDLKWRWQWDPLRRDPRFQKLLAGPEPATVF